MNQVFAFTITRPVTAGRAALLNNTLWQGKETAGTEFDWHVWVNGKCSAVARETLKEACGKGIIDKAHYSDENVGQHIAWNAMFELAVSKGYKHFVRIDDDCQFISKRWLKKLVNFSTLVDDKFIISPVVKSLKNQPKRSSLVYVKGLPVEFLVEAIGGVCRFHPVSLLANEDDPFIADARKPLGSGDATGIAAWCRRNTIPMVYYRQTRVRHNTVNQELADPSYFHSHDLLQTVPYIPLLR